MPEVSEKNFKILFSELLNFGRKLAVQKPKPRRGEMIQSGWQRPASK
jgi:hypothetical protein